METTRINAGRFRELVINQVNTNREALAETSPATVATIMERIESADLQTLQGIAYSWENAGDFIEGLAGMGLLDA